MEPRPRFFVVLWPRRRLSRLLRFVPPDQHCFGLNEPGHAEFPFVFNFDSKIPDLLPDISRSRLFPKRVWFGQC